MSRPGSRQFFCGACGSIWEKHPATVVDCPRCNQPAGSPCLRPSGHNLPGDIPHVEREQRAVDEGLLELCPASARGEGPTKRGREAA